MDFASARTLPRNFESAQALPEQRSVVDLGVTGPIGQWRTDFLFDYDIFPRRILTGETEWAAEGRTMRVGDHILQRAFLPPLGRGFALRFAVRIRALIAEEARCGFAYETLEGHAERGVSEFCFVLRNGRMHFEIHTHSEPAFLLARVARRVVTLPYQAWCTRQALQHVRRRFAEENARLEA